MTRRTLMPIFGAIVIIVVGLGIGYFVSDAPTVPSTPSDRQASEMSRPARQSDQNALPGLQQPNR